MVKIDTKHNELLHKITCVEEKATNAMTLAEENETNIKHLQQDLAKLRTQDLQKQIKDLEDQLDDQVNRNLRSTVVLRRLPLLNEEKTWESTIQHMATYLNPNFGMGQTTSPA